MKERSRLQLNKIFDELWKHRGVIGLTVFLICIIGALQVYHEKQIEEVKAAALIVCDTSNKLREQLNTRGLASILRPKSDGWSCRRISLGPARKFAQSGQRRSDFCGGRRSNVAGRRVLFSRQLAGGENKANGEDSDRQGPNDFAAG